MKLEIELPEVEAYRRDIEREFLGHKVKTLEVGSMKTFPKCRTKKEVAGLVEGFKIEEVERHGMAIRLRLGNGNHFIIRLGDLGRLTKGKVKYEGDMKFEMQFTQGRPLVMSDSKQESTVTISNSDGIADAIYDPKRTGIDLLTHPLSWVSFGRLILSKAMPLMSLLTDQSIFVGIGSIYSNEILFDAGLRYDRPSNELSIQEVRRLYRSVVGVLHEASRHGGTSWQPDRPFYNVLGEEAQFGTQLSVFGRDGELSERSRNPILKTRFKKQVVYYCDTQV